ncbi:MAG: MFS transporter [Armatimonadota bacterium]|nr:MFS transporter [Armatimonadota bacterium]
MTTVATTTQMHREPEGGFLDLMRYRNYRLLWSGQLVSFLGDRVHWVAISLWVYALTGSALSVSFAIVALMLAPGVVGFFAGAIVDRYDRRRIMIIADLARAGLVALIPTLMNVGLPWVYAVLFLVSAASAFFRPAMFAAIPQSVPRDRLQPANAFFATLDSAAEVVGPVIAGLLVATFHYTAAIYANALSFLVSVAFVSRLRLPPVPAPAAAPGTTSRSAAPGILDSIREGLRYIRGDNVQIGLLALLVMGQWVVGLTSLQTPLAKGVLQITDQQFGWFQSVWGLGFVGASLVLGWYGRLLPQGQMIVLGYMLWAVAAGAMALAPNFGTLVATGFWVGFANIVVFVNVGTVMMSHTPPDKLGRAIAVRQINLAVVRTIALVGFGWLGDVVGIRPAILIMAGLALGGTLLATTLVRAVWEHKGTYQPEALPGERLDRKLDEPGWSLILNRLIRAEIEPEFSAPEQRWLNVASVSIVVVGWSLLLAERPLEALGIAATVGFVVGMAVFARSRGWLARVRPTRN